MNFLSFSLTALFLSIGLMHVYWALAGTGQSSAVIPSQDGQLSFVPTPAQTILVALGLFISALIVLGTAVSFWRFGLPLWPFKVGLCGLALIFTLRAIGDFHWVGFFKSVRHTPFARNDTWFYSPLCVGIAIGCAVLSILS
jgi:hypothetical protein